MKISTKGYYSVRAIIDIAIRAKNSPVSLSSISIREDISLHYLEQLFMKLRRSNLVKSVRGPGGGYVLAKKPEEISIGDVLQSVEESVAPKQICVTHHDKNKIENNRCDKIDECVSRLVWQKLSDKMMEILDSISLESLCHEHETLINKKAKGTGGRC
ncbi:MAG TPA: Rrf2 family transcriptional regulator [Nitrospinota bacterium]|nr:Rrf2 family transcriptional regulator [Nitrospinota bacterium]HJN02879.1 Rrf2 family transcriptional regulator [Nitrospinota bacterium]